ncbi:MAG: hypothetical protein HQ546_08895 [Planctomycetes bacterium]|nr:hypothetical protein [Planctomycetota bacterium]
MNSKIANPNTIDTRAVAEGQNAYGQSQIHRKGIMLLDVVLALALFVVASAVVLAGMNACVDSAGRVKVTARATDLAVTLSSELQMGLVQPVDAGPESYQGDRLAGWNWQVRVEPLVNIEGASVSAGSKRVEVIITHLPSGFAYRLVQLLPAGQVRPERTRRQEILSADYDAGMFEGSWERRR